MIGNFVYVGQSRSKFDLHKQVLALKFQNALVRFVRNVEYVDPMTTMGELVQARIAQCVLPIYSP